MLRRSAALEGGAAPSRRAGRIGQIETSALRLNSQLAQSFGSSSLVRVMMILGKLPSTDADKAEE